MLTYKLRTYVQLAKVKYMFFTLPFGTLAGLWLLTNWPNTWMKAILGLILVVYVLSANRLTLGQGVEHPGLAATAGFFGGVFSSAVGAAGPPILIYATAAGWSAIISVPISRYFSCAAPSQPEGLLHQGPIHEQSLPVSALCVPGMVLGGLLGNRLVRHLPQENFHSL